MFRKLLCIDYELFKAYSILNEDEELKLSCDYYGIIPSALTPAALSEKLITVCFNYRQQFKKFRMIKAACPKFEKVNNIKFCDGRNPLSVMKDFILFLNPNKVTFGSIFLISNEDPSFHEVTLPIYVNELEFRDSSSSEIRLILGHIIPTEKLSM